MSQTPTTNLIPSIYLKEYDINSLNFLTSPNKSYEFHLKEFAFIEELGSGRFGIVRKYRHLPSDQMLAIKVNLESLRQKVNLNRMKEDLQKIKIQSGATPGNITFHRFKHCSCGGNLSWQLRLRPSAEAIGAWRISNHTVVHHLPNHPAVGNI